LREGVPANELREAKEAALALGGTTAREQAPSRALRDRLSQSLSRQGRYGVFADRIARLFDLPLAKAEELVRRIEDPAAWKPGWVPGMLSINVRPGPAYPQAMGGFGKLTPGWTFPHHDHVGEETTVVLEGGFRDTHDGAETWRGDELWKPPGTDHEFIVLPGVECIAAVIAVGGVTFR